MLYNPNNVAIEASSLIALLEECVGEQLCLMLGYHISEKNRSNPLMNTAPDGSVANLAALWAAHSLKFYLCALKLAIISDQGPLSGFLRVEAQPFQNQLCTGGKKTFLNYTEWEPLNLTASIVLDIPNQPYNQYGIS